MLFEVFVETKGRKRLDEAALDTSARVFYLPEILTSVLQTLFRILFIEGSANARVAEPLSGSRALTLRDLRIVAVYDPVYEWSEAEGVSLWRPPLVLAKSVRRLAKAFHREEPFARWLLEQTLSADMGTPQDKLESWFEKTRNSFVLCSEGDWLDYIAQGLERLAIVLQLYEEHDVVRLRIHPDVPAMLRRAFPPGTFANPGLTDEEWAEWDEEKDEER